MSHDLRELEGYEMDEEEIESVLEEVGLGVLSMTHEGVPYGIPLAFGYGGTNRLYFLFVGHSTQGRKVTYAEDDGPVSFLAYDVESEGDWRSVIVEGTLDRITPDEWKEAREALAANAYRPELLSSFDEQEDPRVWALDITKKTGRAMGDRHRTE